MLRQTLKCRFLSDKKPERKPRSQKRDRRAKKERSGSPIKKQPARAEKRNKMYKMSMSVVREESFDDELLTCPHIRYDNKGYLIIKR